MHSQQKLLFLEPERSIVGGRLGKGKAESEKDLEREIETGPGSQKETEARKKGRSRCCGYEHGCTQVGKIQALF